MAIKRIEVHVEGRISIKTLSGRWLACEEIGRKLVLLEK